MKKASGIALSIACIAILCSSAYAQKSNTAGQKAIKTITTAVPFLNVTPDSRAGGMGDVGVALANDANAVHWNAAGLAFAPDKIGVAMSYTPWLRSLGIPDINLIYLSGFYNLGETGGTLGSSLRYFSLGEITFTNLDATTVGSDKPNEFALDLAYARKVTPVLSASVALRYFQSRLAASANVGQDLKPVNSVAGDIGIFYNKDFTMKGNSGGTPVTLKTGLNISNIGPKVSYKGSTVDRDFIPVNLRFGYSIKFQIDEYNSVTFANDFNKLMVPSVDSLGREVGSTLPSGESSKSLLEGMFGSFGDAEDGFSEELKEVNIGAGVEYWYRDVFALRGGYFHESEIKGNRRFITVGAGIRYTVFGLDFAYLAPIEQNHPLQNTLRFTLTYNFASPDSDLREE